MSCKSWSEEGYGIALDDVKLKKDKALWEGVKALIKGTEVEKFFMENFDESENPEESWEDVADECADNECASCNGLGWLFAETVNEKEGLNSISKLEAFNMDENGMCYIGVRPILPFASPHYAFENLKTAEEYDAIFRKYLPCITDSNVADIDIVRFEAEYFG